MYETTGISVKVSRSVVQDGNWAVTLKDAISSYSHEISTSHGFDTANVTFAVNRRNVSEWLDRGLGMDIDVRGPSGTQIWNGFVDNVSVNEGPRKISVGRLTEIANMVIASYAIVIEDADEPIIGEQTSTEYASDTGSQDRYGIWEKVISAGARTVTEANQIRDTVLAKYAYPTTSYAISAAIDMTITLQCAGYYRWLDAFTYNTTDNDEVTTNEKVLRLLAAEASVNNVLSTDYTMVSTSSAYVSTFEDQNRTALTIAKECASFGDANNDAWTFGVYEDRQAVFDIVPTTIEYAHRKGLGATIERLSGSTIDPWRVRPGQWLFMPDIILGGEELPIPDTRAQLYMDKRVAFIERVQYSAPYGLNAHGTRLAKSSQGLAKWGLGSL